MCIISRKITSKLENSNNTITGTQIRQLVDAIADSFNCIVVPGSKIRRVRRFLAGQAEGIVAERDFKGVVWDESHQEARLLKQSSSNSTDLILSLETNKPVNTNNSSAIPTDDFVVVQVKFIKLISVWLDYLKLMKLVLSPLKKLIISLVKQQGK